MSKRRKVSSDISCQLIEYVLKEKQWTQEQLAEALELSTAFISRARAKERSLRLDHLSIIESLMNSPIGAILLAAVPITNATEKNAKLREIAHKAIKAADDAAERVTRSGQR